MINANSSLIFSNNINSEQLQIKQKENDYIENNNEMKLKSNQPPKNKKPTNHQNKKDRENTVRLYHKNKIFGYNFR